MIGSGGIEDCKDWVNLNYKNLINFSVFLFFLII